DSACRRLSVRHRGKAAEQLLRHANPTRRIAIMHHQSRMFDNIGSIAFGAGLMYFLDPVQGRRRRALVRDQCASALRQWSDILDKAARDLGNRTRGMVAEAQAAWSRAPVDDAVLVAL